MQRYFLELSFDGTKYSGWQSQPNARTIQGDIENSLCTIYQQKIPLVGCGRTDAGVHAQNYIAHIELESIISIPDFIYKMNGILDNDIVIHQMQEVKDTAHARFDANYRRYEYNIHSRKNPFQKEFSSYIPQLPRWDIDLLHDSASLLLNYKDFYSFCKTNTDVKTTECALYESYWEIDKEKDVWKYTIAANRFLRGMVRLIVGMQLNIAAGKMDLDDVKFALQNKKRLYRDWSVPAKGLFLKEIRYPYKTFN